MALDIREIGEATFEIDIHGKLDKSDFLRVIPKIEEKIGAKGRVSLLVHIDEYAGRTPQALWEDLKFDMKHYKDIARLALVSKNISEDWLATLSKPFTSADTQFYHDEDIDIARNWVLSIPDNNSREV